MPFGLKTAPSLFQKAMIKIFEPILSNALVYIDDILLFSPDIDSHSALLARFHNIVQDFGIMLSEKKMVIGETEIDFLGMHISKGQYHLQPHIASQLQEFPDEKLTFKQVQQFLGIVNYMADFIHDLAKHRSVLSAQLRKDAPPWNQKCTDAVKELKHISKSLPALKIPAKGRRILQTDASDCYWGAVLLEEGEKGERQICGYKSGMFKDSEKHYHSTYKEILAVKRGIEKFEFHLVGQHFLIEMDMSSFPKMIQFKQKALPQAQLLRWASWFSQWKFDVKHIKGKDNFLPDFLSRTQRQISSMIPMIYTINPEAQPNDPIETMIQKLPHALQEEILTGVLKAKGKDKLHGLLKLYIHRYGLDQGPLLGLPYHPDFPFLTTINLNPNHYRKFPPEAYLLLWYLANTYTIGVLVDKSTVLQYLARCLMNRRKTHYSILYKWFTMFHEASWWQKNIREQGGSTLFVTFSISTMQVQEPRGIRISNRYKCEIKTGYNDSPFEEKHFYNRARELTVINGIKESDINKNLFSPLLANWHDPETYPIIFIQEIREVLTSFHDQYSWPKSDYDHPVYRVERRKYMVTKYIPGLKIYVDGEVSGSDISDTDSEDNDLESSSSFGDRGNQ